MHLYKILVIAAGMAMAGSAGAGELDFNVSDDAASIDYASSNSGGSQVSFGLLHNDDGDVYVGDLGLHLVDNAGAESNPFQVGLGGKLAFLDSDFQSGSALALGAFARYNFPSANRFALAGSLHYAPDVIAFNDLSRYLEYDFRAEYEVLRNASIYLGYRKLEIEVESGADADLDDGMHFGMRFVF